MSRSPLMTPAPSRGRRRRRLRLIRLPDHAALGPRPVLRLVLLGILVVLVQLVLLDRISILGARIDLSILGVLVVALLTGPAIGAGFGFGIGVAVDLMSGQSLGMSSLVFSLVGYVLGAFGELRDPESSVAVVLAGLVGTLLALVAYGVLQLLATPNASPSDALVGQTIGTVVAGAILAVPMHNRVRRWLLPMLPEETRRRRRHRTRGSRRRPASVDVRIR